MKLFLFRFVKTVRTISEKIKVLLSEIILTHCKIVVLGNQTCFRLMAYWNIISKIPNNYKVMEGFIKGRRMDEDHSKTNYFKHTRMSNFEIVIVKMGIGYRPIKFLKCGRGSCSWNKDFKWTLKMDFFFLSRKTFFKTMC